MKEMVLIDGNSILNRAFYGIMSSKMLTTPDGKYTNAIYGFLAILFKVLDDIEPEYLMVAFDLKAPTARHKLYEGYKANRKGMPNELAEQMPILKDILRKMNIAIIEKEGYEADDVLGTLSKRAEAEGLDVTIVSGDRDTFQLTSNKIKVRIPHTKLGKTEVDIFDEIAVKEKYGVTPKQLIEVKGLQGDTSDNIPGVAGVGEKTALNLIKDYGSIDKLYEAIEKNEDDLKPKLKEKLIENRELAELSRTLGTINLEVPIEETIEDFKRKPWNNEEVLKVFKELKFNRFIERFDLHTEEKVSKNIHELFEIKELLGNHAIEELLNKIKQANKLTYFLQKEDNKLKAIYILNENIVYQIKIDTDFEKIISYLKPILESKKILKSSYHLNEDTVLFKQIGIDLSGIYFDAKIAAYDLNPTTNNYTLKELANDYLNLDISSYLEDVGIKENSQTQITLFTSNQDEQNLDFEKYQNAMYVYTISKLEEIMIKKLEEYNSLELFNNIEMPLLKVLANMQYDGISVDKEELVNFGNTLKLQIENLTQEIYEM